MSPALWGLTVEKGSPHSVLGAPLSRMAKINTGTTSRTPPPTPYTLAALRLLSTAWQGSSHSHFTDRKAKARDEPSRAWNPALRERPFPPPRLGTPLICLQLSQSLTANDLPGSLSKINKNVLKFNLKNLALIIYIEYFSSSKRSVWEFRPQEGMSGEGAELPC